MGDLFSNGRYSGPDPAQYDRCAGDFKYGALFFVAAIGIVGSVIGLLIAVFR